MARIHDYPHGECLIVFTLTSREVTTNLLQKEVAVDCWFMCLLLAFNTPFLGGKTEVFLEAKSSAERRDPCVEVRLEEKGDANFSSA